MVTAAADSVLGIGCLASLIICFTYMCSLSRELTLLACKGDICEDALLEEPFGMCFWMSVVMVQSRRGAIQRVLGHRAT